LRVCKDALRRCKEVLNLYKHSQTEAEESDDIRQNLEIESQNLVVDLALRENSK